MLLESDHALRRSGAKVMPPPSLEAKQREVASLRRRPTLPAASQQSAARFALFMSLWLAVGLVAAYDTFLTVKYCDFLHQMELNPVGRWLMGLDSHRTVAEMTQVAYFLAVKFMGTVFVLGAMATLYCYRQPIGLTVAGAVATVQLGLGVYLTFA